MLQTAQRVLSTVDAREYLVIITAFFAACKRAEHMEDVAIAAGIAEEDLVEFRGRLLGESGQDSGKATVHHLKPI